MDLIRNIKYCKRPKNYFVVNQKGHECYARVKKRMNVKYIIIQETIRLFVGIKDIIPVKNNVFLVSFYPSFSFSSPPFLWQKPLTHMPYGKYVCVFVVWLFLSDKGYRPTVFLIVLSIYLEPS